MPSDTLNIYATPKGACGLRWDSYKRNFMEFIVPAVQYLWSEDSQLDIISSSYAFRSYGEMGDRLFDLMVIMCAKDRENLKNPKVIGLFESFAHDFPMFDFVKTFRSLLYHADNTHIISSCMTMFNLLIAAYNRGALLGVMSDEEVVVVTDEFDVLTIELVILLLLRERDAGNLRSAYRISEKRSQRFWKHILKNDVYGLVPMLRSWDKHKLVSYMDKFRSICKYAYTANSFNEVTTDFTYHNNMTAYAFWGRDDTLKKSIPMILYTTFFEERFVPLDILKHRNIYVRDKGVKICLKELIVQVDSISLREYHSEKPFEEHYLLVHYESEGISRFLPIDLTNYDHTFMHVLFEKDVMVLMLVYAWLGVLDRIDFTTAEMMSHFPDSKREAWEYSVSKFNDLKMVCRQCMSEDNLRYEDPAHWNYHGSNRINFKSDADPIYAKELRKVGRYTRTLPKGQKPSPEAIRLAKKFFIELEEGKTLVDSFVRSQRIRLNK